MKSIFDTAYFCLMLSDSVDKCNAVFNFKEQVEGNNLTFNATDSIKTISSPGRPDKPCLVPPRDLPRRSLSKEQGRIALIHAITHIEFNAINLALDAIYRFQNLPNEYYTDWLHVAYEEAQHFLMLRNRLHKLGYDYGSFEAHNGLWEMAVKTSDHVITRMALVPRVLEARGLDVTPGMIKKFQEHGDNATANILKIIFEQEIGHVAIGSRWFKYACKQQNVMPEPTFQNLLRTHFSGQLRGPFELEARRKAGFTATELEVIQNY